MKEYELDGSIEIEDGKVRITSRGARVLAGQALGKALENLAKKEMGTHLVKETGYGSELSFHTRRYELGDQYESVDVQRTLINALERRASMGREMRSGSRRGPGRR